MRSRVIGGEFELKAVPAIEPYNKGLYCYASGRTALYQILKSIKLTTFKVWLPDWLCESMIDAVKKAGIDYGFYTLGSNLRMDVKSFVEKNRPVSEQDVILLVNYFGLVDVNLTIAELRDLKVESVIIEDDVQALFSFLNNDHTSDYCFTSLRKSIAAPDGGLVRTKYEMPLVNKTNSFTAFKLKGALIKGSADENTNDDEYLSCFERGEELIEENYDGVMSDEAARIFAGTDLETVALIRRENAEYLIDELFKLGISPLLPLKEGYVPLFVPILIDNRDEVRRTLRKKGIFCPVHWPLREDMQQLATGKMMAEKELSLVIDQRYGLEDMQSIVETIKDCLCK